jgi:hypothetical protein
MCWNPDISLNTFLFACFGLAFIWVANTFTKYKSSLFENNKLIYVFFFATAAMQLVEFFLWKNLKNAASNTFWSKIASFVIVVQQVTLMLLIPSPEIRKNMLLLYAVFLGSFFLYKKIFSPIRFYTTVAKNGHLSWDWLGFKGYEIIWMVISLLFYILPLYFIQNTTMLFFITILLIASLFLYFKDGTFGTVWCWASNFSLLYFIVDILLIQPFYEYNGLC